MKKPSAQPTAQSAQQDQRLHRLATLVELERRMRAAEDVNALSFLLVNETHGLAPYRQAVLWQAGSLGNGEITRVSGLATPDSQAPFTVWARKVCNHLAQERQDSQARALSAEDLPEGLARDWSQWLPTHALWLPLRSAAGKTGAGLLLARESAWLNAEIRLLQYLADAFTHAWERLQPDQRPLLRRLAPRRRVWTGALILLGLLALLPVHQTTLVPAEIIARDPALVRAPIDGVIDEILVRPNQSVDADTRLLTLDATRLANDLEVARHALDVAEAEYRQAAQQGLFDREANARLAVLRGRMEQHRAEAGYLEKLLARSTVHAPRAGIVVFDNVSDWQGRPVTIGERIMQVADPQAVELELRVPVSDAIALDEGARVRLFLNTDPHRPVEATLRYASYQADLGPDGSQAYRLVASFADDVRPLRIGLKGTARLYGERTILIHYLLRRPLTTVRQVLGV